MKKYLAEMVGTMVLVLMGCGTAVSLSCGVDAASVVGTALAFGLAVVAMAYTIGGISGCHINPAITLGVWLSKRMSGKDAAMYMLFQVIGAFIGAGILMALAPESGLGANAVQQGITVGGAVLAEVVFTFVFVLVVLGTTDAEKGAGNLAGLELVCHWYSFIWYVSTTQAHQLILHAQSAQPCWQVVRLSLTCGSSSLAHS